jgi:formate hydrogenlyase transcriptional activator
MSGEISGAPISQSWRYGQVAALPLSEGIEEPLLMALRRLTETLDVQGVCEAVLGGVENVFGASSSWIMLHNPATDTLRTALFRGRGAHVYDSVEIPADRGVTGAVFSSGDIRFIADVTREQRWFDPERVCASGLRTVILLPLMVGSRRIGVLGADSPHFGVDRAPSAVEVKRLEIFAAQAAIGLMNARLYQTSQQDRNRLRAVLNERKSLQREVLTLRDEVRTAFSSGQIVCESELMRSVLTDVQRVAASDVTVLFLGETGTGKELLARALHERSERAPRPFVPVNCAALPENLVESEMFGYERGAFTGAHIRKPGRFELADRGTLFLDEIGDLPLNAQAKLLRVLQDGEVHRIGSTKGVKVDIRIVAATNHDLAAAVTEGKFREDLFYRLSVFPIRIPPLRERLEDIPALANHLALQCARRMGKRITGIGPGVLEVLTSYDWPGNVRELQNVIERSVILAVPPLITSDAIRLESMPLRSTHADRPVTEPASAASDGSPRATPRTLADAERQAIIDALRRAEGRISGRTGAAALLGLKPTTLHAKMKKLRVRRGDALRL